MRKFHIQYTLEQIDPVDPTKKRTVDMETEIQCAHYDYDSVGATVKMFDSNGIETGKITNVKLLAPIG